MISQLNTPYGTVNYNELIIILNHLTRMVEELQAQVKSLSADK